MIRKILITAFIFFLIASLTPESAKAFSLATLSLDLFNLPVSTEKQADQVVVPLHSDSDIADSVKDATNSAELDDAFLKDYFSDPVENMETDVRVLPVFPLNVKGISTYFSSIHLGIDVRADIGTPVVALHDGTVAEVEYQPGGYGRFVVIEHEQDGKRIRSLYAHLKESSVSVGQTVTAREPIGLVGLTGHTTGPHLHFETRICTEGSEYYTCIPMDPLRYITKGIPSYLAKK